MSFRGWRTQRSCKLSRGSGSRVRQGAPGGQTMTQTPIDRPHVLVKPDLAETLTAAPPVLGPYTLRSITASFDVSYDTTLGSAGQSLADAVIGRCEEDLQQVAAWFAGASPGRFAL